MTASKLNAIRRVNAAYERGDYDTYDALVERYAKQFGEGYPGQFEDDCTDVRMFGEEGC